MVGQEEEAAIGRQTEQQTESREPDARRQAEADGQGAEPETIRLMRRRGGSKILRKQKHSDQNVQAKKERNNREQRAEKGNEQIQKGNKSRQK